MGYKSTGLVLAEKPSIGIEPTRLYDASRLGNHGTHTNITMVQLPSGLWVRSLAGDGYVTIADASSFDIKKAITAIIWVAVDNIAIGGEIFFSKYRTDTANREWSLGKFGKDGTVYIQFGDPNDGTFEGRQESDASELSNATWALVGFTFNVGTAVIYVNGVAVDSSVGSGAIPASLFNGTSDVKVGAFGDNTIPMTGKFALPCIKNYALSAGQIKKIFEAERHFFGV